jgi:hypothetical protein
MSLKSALRKMSRAFATKDERAFDEAMEEFENKLEKDESPEEAIEIHNHIPGQHDSMGELPSKEFNVSSPAFDGDEAPPWFKKHEEATDARFKKMNDSFEDFIKGKKKEGEEAEDRQRDRRDGPTEGGEHPSWPGGEFPSGGIRGDRHGKDESEEEREEGERGEDRRDNEEENLEMDRQRDRSRDRGRANNDEANKEILGELEFEAPPGTGDRAMKAKDSKYLEEAFQDAVAKAEVLAPGLRLPTFDRAAKPSRTLNDIVKLRRTALDLAYNQPATRGIIDQAMSGRTMDSKRMSLSSARVLFNSVASAVASSNNSRATDRGYEGGGVRTNTNGARIQTLADINKVNREAHSKH